MLEIDTRMVTHHLSIKTYIKPIAWRKRKVDEENMSSIDEEVGKIFDVGFITKKYPTWLTNVVLVKKENNKWHMCVDFTILNTACPKSLYPLPDTDSLINGSSSYCILSFMDAYLGV